MREGEAMEPYAYDDPTIPVYLYDSFLEAIGAIRILYNVTAANGFC